MTDLNELSDEALRLALARALERNALLEGLIVSIGKRVESLDDFTLEFTAEEYAKVSLMHDSLEAYQEAYSWIEDERDGETSGDKYPHECPFFSESFLYDLFGKEEARTILSYFQQIQYLATEDEHTLNRRTEYRARIINQIKNISHYKDMAERAKRHLDDLKLPKKQRISRQRRTIEAWQKDYDDAIAAIVQSSTGLAHNVQRYFEDY